MTELPIYNLPLTALELGWLYAAVQSLETDTDFIQTAVLEKILAIAEKEFKRER